MFPIACITYGVFWMIERYQIAYCYQLPPSLDDTLTKNAIKMLRIAPILFLFNGYWMLTNMQIFNDIVFPISSSKEIMLTGHTFESVG